ncbi:MAG TPA: alcohol dehydrogenase catalytic domain-containing protein [Pyrinomonadaceae bacterium]|nr:alcohol dehydrogenase catalytic domain-containing protein [Pyrinomonadaceae bacterium]
MKALRYENQQLRVADVSKPVPEGEALVRVTLSGICNTDLEIARGYAGFEGTLGHEFVGVIEQSPQAGDALADEPSLAIALRPGQRVVGEINAGCGHCDLCRRGDSRHCPKRTVLGIVGRDGAHAEFLKLPLRNLRPVPDALPDAQAVFTEPLAAACGILERVSIDRQTKLAVIGDGKLGLLCAQVLGTTGAQVTLIGKHEPKLLIAKKRDLETMLSDKAGERAREFDVVVEASGSPTGFDLALNLLRPRGTLVLKSTFHGTTEFDAAQIVVNEINVVGSRCGRFAPALELLKTGAVDVESLISEEFTLTDGVRGMARAAEPGVMKVLLRA